MNAAAELKRLFVEHRTDLVRFAALSLRDEALAEDVVQEAMMAALRSLEGFGGRSSLKTWLYAIVKRKVLDALRARRRETPLSQLHDDNDSGDDDMLDRLFDERGHWHADHRPQRWTDPDESLEQEQFWAVFEICVRDLPVRPGRVFAMRELLGLDTEEICKELAITASNCWVLLHRARLRLRACLEARWFATR